MRPDLETYYLIDQYLDNKLKGVELAAFEDQLQNDVSFANEVTEQRMLNDLILEAELKSVRTQMATDLANIQNPSFFRMYWKWIGVGLVSLSTVLYFSISEKNNTNKVITESSIQSAEYREETVNSSTETPTNNHSVTQSNAVTNSAETKTAVLETGNTSSSIDSIHVVKDQTAVTVNAAPIHTSTTSQPEVKYTAEISKTDCSLVKIAITSTTEASCEQSETGAIHIEKISGGIAPYSYSLNNKREKEKNLSDLAAGTYEIKITDKNGCSSNHTVYISEKNCTPKIQQGLKFNINPTIGETCSIPFDSNKKGNVTVYNRSGKIIYRESNPSTDHVEWSGTDGYGALAEAGLYVYIVEYTDGTKVTGEVNIIR